MARLALEMIFELEGLRVDPNALGSSVVMRSGRVAVRIDLREEETSFTRCQHVKTLLRVVGHSADPREAAVSRTALLRQGSTVEVRLVGVMANLDATFGIGDYEDWTVDPARQLEADAIFTLLAEGTAAITAFCEWLWVTNEQYRNEPTGEYPKLVAGIRLADVDASLYFPTMLSAAATIHVLPASAIISREDLQTAAAAAQRGRPDLGSLLLAEAQHFLWKSDRLAPDRAVVLAAMAAELLVKTVLRECVPEDKRALVDLILASQP